ncbi:MAG: hypothetical protein HYY20_03520 [Candidatus Tectomicrobia bacterium]|uniref:Uncharacterized protein n=1 Tax=Tectimicrobiota bacterium TaxID=2528274 RepID=A0A932CMN5_UNCTE|nr:hypothetical protein [Candidatus Tectomicrobia bacterium]
MRKNKNKAEIHNTGISIFSDSEGARNLSSRKIKWCMVLARERQRNS